MTRLYRRRLKTYFPYTLCILIRNRLTLIKIRPINKLHRHLVIRLRRILPLIRHKLTAALRKEIISRQIIHHRLIRNPRPDRLITHRNNLEPIIRPKHIRISQLRNIIHNFLSRCSIHLRRRRNKNIRLCTITSKRINPFNLRILQTNPMENIKNIISRIYIHAITRLKKLTHNLKRKLRKSRRPSQIYNTCHICQTIINNSLLRMMLLHINPRRRLTPIRQSKLDGT